MIQRVQTIWLLLAVVFAALNFIFPFYVGAGDVIAPTKLDAQSSVPLSILAGLTGAVALVTIFLFRNRKAQLRLSLLGVSLSAALLTVYILESRDLPGGAFALSSVFAFLLPVLFILAYSRINKDEKLIKSMDRLR